MGRSRRAERQRIRGAEELGCEPVKSVIAWQVPPAKSKYAAVRGSQATYHNHGPRVVQSPQIGGRKERPWLGTLPASERLPPGTGIALPGSMDTNIAEQVLAQHRDFPDARDMVDVPGLSSARVCHFLNRLVSR